MKQKCVYKSSTEKMIQRPPPSGLVSRYIMVVMSQSPVSPVTQAPVHCSPVWWRPPGPGRRGSRSCQSRRSNHLLHGRARQGQTTGVKTEPGWSSNTATCTTGNCSPLDPLLPELRSSSHWGGGVFQFNLSKYILICEDCL